MTDCNSHLAGAKIGISIAIGSGNVRAIEVQIVHRGEGRTKKYHCVARFHLALRTATSGILLFVRPSLCLNNKKNLKKNGCAIA